jgi:hypothetical protein
MNDRYALYDYKNNPAYRKTVSRLRYWHAYFDSRYSSS